MALTIVKGSSDTDFSSDNSSTREQMAGILAGKDEVQELTSGILSAGGDLSHFKHQTGIVFADAGRILETLNSK